MSPIRVSLRNASVLVLGWLPEARFLVYANRRAFRAGSAGSRRTLTVPAAPICNSSSAYDTRSSPSYTTRSRAAGLPSGYVYSRRTFNVEPDRVAMRLNLKSTCCRPESLTYTVASSNFGSSYFNVMPLVLVRSPPQVVWLAPPTIRMAAIPIGNDFAQRFELICRSEERRV